MGDVALREGGVPHNIKTPVLLTPRLVLRLPHPEDTESLAQLANNAQVSRCFDKMPYPFGRADAEDFICRAEAGEVGAYVYAITLAETGEFIGCCGIGSYKTGRRIAWVQPDAADGGRFSRTGADSGRHTETELFFWLGQPYWRRAYGSEVALALTDAAFRATEIEALYARSDPANTAAARILGKCGFALLGAGAEAAAGAETAQGRAYYQLDRDSWLRLRSEAVARPKAADAAPQA